MLLLQAPAPDLHLADPGLALASLLQALDFRALRSGLLHQPHSAAPAPQAPWRFVRFSCQYPHDVLNRTPELRDASVGPADASWLEMERVLNQHRPGLLIQNGDRVHIDAAAGMFDSQLLSERYRQPYPLRLESRAAKVLQRHLPAAIRCLPDDHEIYENWQPDMPAAGGANDSGPAAQAREAGLRALWASQRLRQIPANAALPPHCWSAETHAGVPFFFADTRTERQAPRADNWSSRTSCPAPSRMPCLHGYASPSRVQTRFEPAGDGFALLSIVPGPASEAVAVEFHDGHGARVGSPMRST